MCVTLLPLNFLHLLKENPTFTRFFFLGIPDPSNMPDYICQPSPHYHILSWMSFIFSDVISPNWLISALQVEGEQPVQQSVSLIFFKAHTVQLLSVKQLFKVTFLRRVHLCLWAHPTQNLNTGRYELHTAYCIWLLPRTKSNWNKIGFSRCT